MWLSVLEATHSPTALLASVQAHEKMVSPTINRKRGKTREQRVRDNRRMNKANLKAAGKIKKQAVRDPRQGKKKLKKKEQRARLLAKSAGGAGDKMQD